jgi:hypothetical protein
MNEDKNREFVKQVIHTHTWWRLKTKLEETLLGKKTEHQKSDTWKTDA